MKRNLIILIAIITVIAAMTTILVSCGKESDTTTAGETSGTTVTSAVPGTTDSSAVPGTTESSETIVTTAEVTSSGTSDTNSDVPQSTETPDTTIPPVTSESLQTLVTTEIPVAQYPVDDKGNIKLFTAAEFITAMLTKPDGKYILANDIDFNNVYIEPLCSVDTPFSGIIDGDGHSLKNLKITVDDITADKTYIVHNEDNYAIFTYTGIFVSASESAVFKNLNLDSTNEICMENKSLDENLAIVGGLVADSRGASFINVVNKGIVKYNSEWEFAAGINFVQIGGIAGVGYGNFTDCRNEGTIYSFCADSSWAKDTGYESASGMGGIIGTANGTTEITGCINVGPLYFFDGSTAVSNGIGGICGQSSCLTQNVVSLIINNCGNTGNITTYARGQIAGIMGYDGNCKDNARTLEISYCFNSGTITNLLPSNEDRSAGIIALCSYGNISYCYNTGTITEAGHDNSSSGICGWMNDNKGGSVSNCYNAANVETALTHVTGTWSQSNMYFSSEFENNTYNFIGGTSYNKESVEMSEGFYKYTNAQLTEELLKSPEWCEDSKQINGNLPIFEWMEELGASDIASTESLIDVSAIIELY